MKKFVITIAREFGSLGRPIAKRLAELLDVEFYDRDIVEAAAKKMSLPVSVISKHEEKKSGFFQMMFPLGTESMERQKAIFDCQSKIISDLAAKESCIIVVAVQTMCCRESLELCMSIFMHRTQTGLPTVWERCIWKRQKQRR